MRTKPIATGVVVIAVLLFTSIVFITARPSPPTITVRHVKSIQSGDLVTAIFEITNYTTSRYHIYPISVEVSNGLVWKACFDWNSESFPIDVLGPHGSESRLFFMTNLATGSPLRLRMVAHKNLASLQSDNVLERFLIRLNLRFREGQKTYP